MPNSPQVRTRPLPKLRHHKPSGRAAVTLNGKHHYLGRYGTEAARRKYDRLIAEWLANNRHLPKAGSQSGLDVSELLTLYVRHAKTYYLKNGKPTSSLEAIKQAIRPMRRLYGDTPAAEFGPRQLKAARQTLIDLRWTPQPKSPDRDHEADQAAEPDPAPIRRLTRETINKRVRIIRQIFRWGSEEGLLEETVWRALLTVVGLKKGRSEAPEGKGVKQISDATVETTIARLSPTLADMVRLQRLTGCRPDEVCIFRPGDVDRSGEIWEYRPGSHKNEHHDLDRIIFIGPKAQEILAPYLLRAETAYCFSPSEVIKRFCAQKRANRKTPMTPSQAKRRPKRNPRTKAGERYTRDSYRRAIHRACDKADVPRWSPNRLRHTAASKIRRKYGVEGSQVVLGHAKADVTQVYAERNFELARSIVREVG